MFGFRKQMNRPTTDACTQASASSFCSSVLFVADIAILVMSIFVLSVVARIRLLVLLLLPLVVRLVHRVLKVQPFCWKAQS